MKWDRARAKSALLFLLVLAVLSGLAWRSGVSVPADAPLMGDEALVDETQDSRPKLIALTFDDGPRRSTTTKLLDGLAERGVHATFFLIGAQIEGSEDLVLRMDQEGHQIGIHTFDHVRLTGLSATDFAGQVDRTRTLLENILGHDSFLLRPPYGMIDRGVELRAGAPIILWSVDPEDWRDRDTAREVSHILSQARDGSIVLLHDIYPESVEAALQVVDALHQEGYLFCTVEELFSARMIPLKDGEVYRSAYP